MRIGNDSYVICPPRPSLTPAFLGGVSFWLAILVSKEAIVFVDSSMLLVLASVFFVLSALLVLPFLKQRISSLFISACLFAGLSIGFCFEYVVSNFQVIELAPEGGTVEFTLSEDSKPSAYGRSALAHLNGAPYWIRVKLLLDDDDILLAGESIAGNASFSCYDEDDSRLIRDGLIANCKIKSYDVIPSSPLFGFLHAIRANSIECFAGDDESSIVLSAAVCGWRENLKGSEVYDRFKNCGLAHLVAVSGAHLSIVSSLIVAMLSKLGLSRKARLSFTVCTLACYFVFSGCPISALRAAVMSIVGILGLDSGRRASSLNALGISIFALIAINPASAHSISFALSVLSTMGIVLFCRLLSYKLESTLLGSVPVLGESISLTLAATALSQPISSSVFAQLPLVSPVSNMACGVLFPIACTTGILAAVSHNCFPAFFNPLLFIAHACVDALLLATDLLTSIPYSCIPAYIDMKLALIVTVTISSLLWLAWDKAFNIRVVLPIAIATIVATAIAFAPTHNDEIIMLDVGQGDAFLLRSNAISLLIDTGNNDTALLAALARHHVYHLDAVAISHADDDHCGSLDALEGASNVDKIVLHEGMFSCKDEKCVSLCLQAAQTAQSVVTVNEGDVISFGKFSLRVVWPHAFTEQGGNADSMCFIASYDNDGDGNADARILFTGDAESKQLEKMIAAGTDITADILKVGHHGSRNGLTENLVRSINPKLALISVGENNRYGHPAPETLDVLNENGTRILRSDLSGDVSCKLGLDEIAIETQR